MTKLFTLFILCICQSINAQIDFTLLSTPTSEILKAISFYDANIGYACGEGGVIIKTIDGGDTWLLLDSGTNDPLWDLDIIPNSEGQDIVVVGSNNTVLKSTDGGDSWSPQTIPFQFSSFVFGIHCLDDLNYVACGGDWATNSGSVLITENGGNTWTKTPLLSTGFLDKIFMTNTEIGYTVGTYTTFSNGSINKTIDGGNTFQTVKSSNHIITNLWVLNDLTIIAVGDFGQIWRSSDAGDSWTDLSVDEGTLYDISFMDSSKGMACGGVFQGGNIILATEDAGETWTEVDYDFGGTFQSLSYTDSHLFICGDSGTIIRTELIPLSTIENTKNNNIYTLFPNPIRDYVYIENTTYSDHDFQVDLFNTKGQLVISEKSINGQITLNTKELSSGYYLYKIKNKEGYFESGKILKNEMK